MIHRSLLPSSIAAFVLAGTFGVAAPGRAQSPANSPAPAPVTTPGPERRPGSEAKPTANPPVAPAPPAAAPSANPLVLSGPTRPQSALPGAASAPALPETAAAFGDYRRGPDSQGPRPRTKPLPYFCYNFFEPARQIIVARRTYLQGRYGAGGATTGAGVRKPGESSSASGKAAVDAPAEMSDEEALRLLKERGVDAPPTPELLAEYKKLLRTGDPSAAGSASEKAGLLPSGKTSSGTAGAAANEEARGDGAPGAMGAPVDSFREVADPLTQLYRNVVSSVPPSYQLAPGDTLTVRYASPTRAAREATVTLDSQGAIRLDGAGTIVLRGLTPAQAEKTLQQRLARLYRNVEASVALKELRTISVTVSGEAFAPGTYMVPAVATADTLVHAAGGPTEEGSLRRLEVRRRGALVGTLDYYKIATGQPVADIALQPGDLIYIPPRLSRVTIDGEVRSPAVFELTEHETLRDALRYAGGAKPSAVDQRVQVSTLAPGAARVLKDVNLRSLDEIAALPLYDGDAVEVFSVRDTLANRVTVEGAVDQPGDYALVENMRIADLIRRARGPLSEAFLTRADLQRWNPDNTLTLISVDIEKALAGDPAANLPLARWDRLKIYSRAEVAWTGQRDVTVRGAVQRPGVYYRSENLRVSDLLRMAGGPTPDAHRERAVLLHQRPDGSFAYDYVSLSEIERGDNADDALIQDNDVLAVYRADEAQFTPEHVVAIRGEVVSPGIYPRGEAMRLSDLVRLAGGFRPGAGGRVTIAHARKNFDTGEQAQTTVSVDFTSPGVCAPDDDRALQDGDMVLIPGTGGFKNRVQFVTIHGAVNHPGPIALSSNTMRLSDALNAAGGLRREAYPDGAEFYRDPSLLASAGQRGLAQMISQLNDLLNQNTFQREQARSDLERIKAAGTASQNESSPLAGLAGGGSAPGAPSAAATAVASQLGQRDLVSPPRVLSTADLAPDGNIAVNVAEAIKRPGGSEDLLLVDGDTITIPEQPSTIQVLGAVFNARSVLVKPGARLDHYVAQCGGFTPDAARDRIVVIQAGGGLIPADKVGALKPGDVIVVPTRVLAEKLQTKSNGLDSLFRSITNSAIVFRLAGSLFGL